MVVQHEEKSDYLAAKEEDIPKTAIAKYIINNLKFGIELVCAYIVLGLKYIFYLAVPNEAKSISNKLALVTGGGSGLGRDISLNLAKAGCRVAVVDLDIEAAEETVQLIKTFNISAKAYKADVSIYEEVENLREKIEKDLGPVDILVNNADIVELETPSDPSSSEEIDRTMRTNILPYFWTKKVFLSGMIERRSGHFVAIGSIAGFFALPEASTYSTSKAAVYGFMGCFKTTLLDEKQDDFIKLTTVIPYFISTTNSDVMRQFKKFKFSSLITPYSSSYVADKVVDGIRRNKELVFLPRCIPILLFFWFILSENVHDYIIRRFF